MQSISFQKYGSGGEVFVFLHGWPGDRSKWGALIALMGQGNTCYALDLPGWGETPLPRVYTLADYVSDVRAFLEQEHIVYPIIVGHSFGGRVAIKLLATYPTCAKKLILIASAGIERKPWYMRMLYAIKPFAPRWIRARVGALFASPDYQATSGVKRETFVHIVSENLETLLPLVTTPTLLIWGDADRTTPLRDGKIMERALPNAELVLIPHGDHGLPYRKSEAVAGAIEKFI